MSMESRSSVKKSKIQCINISKHFVEGTNKISVLENISFDVLENQFIVILGPGQSGKTTLLNIIAGLVRPSTGSVLLDGKEVTGPGSERGLVFQSYMLFPWKTVAQNIELGPSLKRLSRKEKKEIVSYYIDLVGLKGFEKSFPHQLSGGMKQRVGIARAYANNPEVMLLDEPFGQLDAQTRYMMEQEIIRIWEKEKKTIIFVTNNIEEAIFLGDRIITIEGKLPGKVKAIYDVNLPRPRLQTDMDFLKLRNTINDATQLVL